MGEEGEGLVLVLGGARSGKSAVAERLVARFAGPVVYVATGPVLDPAVPDPGDEDWAARLAAHRARRPPEWTTLEGVAAAELPGVLAGLSGTALVESLGTWVAALEQFGLAEEADGAGAAPFDALLAALGARRRAGRPTVVVAEEVGLGVVPATALGGRFRDALGELNRRVAELADEVLLVVAGRVLALPSEVAP